jgi:solute:Na+ symporter, SSS family
MDGAAPSISLLDWIIVIASLVLVAVAGGWFARRQKSTETYFVANRTVPGWAVGLSLYGTAISTQTFIAYPGHGFGGDWTRLLPGYMLLLVAVFVILLVIPLYRQIVKMSAYEYLERRFGYGARAYAGAVYVIAQLLRMGIILFLGATVFHTMAGWDLRWTILVSGAITILYTVVGGLEAVIWTDVIQAIILLGGGLVCAGVLLFGSDTAPLEMIRMAREAGKFHFADFSFDLSRPTAIVMVLYGLMTHMTVYVTQQDMVQRYLAVPTEREANKSMWITTLGCVFTWTLFMFIGTLLFIYYRVHPDLMPKHLKSDAIFPYFIMTQLPSGLIGLILAAMIAAAMSSLSTSINTMSMVSIVDFYSRFRPNVSDRGTLLLAKVAACFWGLLGTGAGLLMIRVQSALDFSFTIISIMAGGLVGMFFLAFFMRRVHARGVYCGLAAGVLVTFWGIVKALTDSNVWVPDFLRRHPFPFDPFLLAFCSNFVCFVVGYLASCVIPAGRSAPVRSLTIWDMRREHASVQLTQKQPLQR